MLNFTFNSLRHSNNHNMILKLLLLFECFLPLYFLDLKSLFIPDEWGPCSVTCGEGIRRREVHCKIFLEFSRTTTKLPYEQCSGPKPLETERCFMEPCSAERIDIKDDPYKSETSIKVGGGSPGTTYSWKEQGYTHCSASCLGGVQELIVNCVRDDTAKVTSPYMCPRELKPEVLIRTCNDDPCPPRWNYSDFQPCSQSCGIGIQTREVNCIHEVTQGGWKIVVVPSNMCPRPRPRDRQYCNVLDCPVRWKFSDWSKCSKSCGGGEKSRTVECKQVMSQNHTIDRPSSMCSSSKPTDRNPCNTRRCVLENDKPQIDVSNSTFIQHDPNKKKFFFKVGGAATVFYGSIIEIICPVKRFNRKKIQWVKDQNYLPKSKKYKVYKKGTLRILNLTYTDSGIYTCIAGRSSAELVLSVKPRPGEFPISEETETDELKPLFGNDNHSHEQRPDLPRKAATPRTRIILPTFPPYEGSGNLNINSLNALPPQSTTLVSDDDEDRVVTTHSSASSDSLKPPVPSSGSRVMPHFHQLISNLQTFSNSQRHQMVAAYLDNHLADDFTSQLETTTEEGEFGSVVVLGKGTPENLKFEWTTTDWSNYSKCFTWNTAIQRRGVTCQNSENKTIDYSNCDENDKPPHRRECYREQCKGMWKVGPWSKCVAACDMQGVKYRILQCVWYGTKRPAGTACRDQSRPPVMKSCKGQPCSMMGSNECNDHSIFCENVKAMNLCTIVKYQHQCCQTCQKSNSPIK